MGGWTLSSETKERMRIAHLGMNHPQGYKEKQSAIMKTIMNTPEARKINSEAHKKYFTKNPHIKTILSDLRKKRWADENYRTQAIERLIGGFWYGNVREPDKYCSKFNNTFKERVRAYWEWECVVCGEIETTTRLSIHHVHYDKKMCCNGSPRDVVALCRPCHTATLYNRDMWEKLFTDLIYSEEHNGKSFLTKEEMAMITDDSH